MVERLPDRPWTTTLYDNFIGIDDEYLTPGEKVGMLANMFGNALLSPIDTAKQVIPAVEDDLNYLMFEGGAMAEPERVMEYAVGLGAPGIARSAARGFDPTILSANPNLSAKELKQYKKEDLDPYGYQSTKLRHHIDDTDVEMTPQGNLLPRTPINWEQMEGKVVMPFYGDRTSGDRLITGVNDIEFNNPVYTEGGVDFKRGLANQRDNAIWASNQSIITRLANEAEKYQRLHPDADIVGMTGSMAPNANDFAVHTGSALAEMFANAPITKKYAKGFDADFRAVDPTFPGVHSPDLRTWIDSVPPEMRKRFLREVEKNPQQAAGFPSTGVARYAVTDPTQQSLPAGMFGMGASRIDTELPTIYNNPKGNLPQSRVPHSTYDTQMQGEYLGSLPPVPQSLLFKDVYDAMEGKTTKSGQPLSEAHKTHAIKTKVPGQLITPEIMDGIMQYLSSPANRT